ncbi:unnamed protein product [Brassica rapa subsp. narinosa]
MYGALVEASPLNPSLGSGASKVQRPVVSSGVSTRCRRG